MAQMHYPNVVLMILTLGVDGFCPSGCNVEMAGSQQGASCWELADWWGGSLLRVAYKKTPGDFCR